jgi:hypothetical protein
MQRELGHTTPTMSLLSDLAVRFSLNLLSLPPLQSSPVNSSCLPAYLLERREFRYAWGGGNTVIPMYDFEVPNEVSPTWKQLLLL